MPRPSREIWAKKPRRTPSPSHGPWTGWDEIAVRNLYRARRVESSIDAGGPLPIWDDRVYPLNAETGTEAPDGRDPVLRAWTARQARC